VSSHFSSASHLFGIDKSRGNFLMMFLTHPQEQTVCSVQYANKHILIYVRTVFRFRVPESRTAGWLHVNLHPGHPATGQMNPLLPRFSAVLQKNAEQVHKLHAVLHSYYADFPSVTSKLPKAQHMQPSQYKIQNSAQLRLLLNSMLHTHTSPFRFSFFSLQRLPFLQPTITNGQFSTA